MIETYPVTAEPESTLETSANRPEPTVMERMRTLLLNNFCHVKNEEVLPDGVFGKVLYDSLDRIQAIQEWEEAFNIDLPDIRPCNTFEEITRAISSALGKQRHATTE